MTEPKKWEATADRPEHAGERLGGGGSFPGYTIEARVTGNPVELAGQVFDNRWRHVSFMTSRIGIPISGICPEIHQRAGTFEYAAAQALRWWLHAEADAALKICTLETRIVKHKVEYQVHHTAESIHDPIGGDSRTAVMPFAAAQPASGPLSGGKTE